MTHAIAIIATGIWMLANIGHAQPRTFRMVYPERPQGMQKTAYLFDGSESREISLPNMNLSEVMRLADGEITIAITMDKIETPELLPANAPKLIIPEHARDFYIIITADPGNAYFPVKMNLADMVKYKTGPGETLWYNLTDHRIVAKLGAADMSVEPLGQTVSRAPADASGYYEARFEYQVRGEGAFAPITEQNWWHDAACRHLGFMVNTGGKLPKIYYFRDFRLP